MKTLSLLFALGLASAMFSPLSAGDGKSACDKCCKGSCEKCCGKDGCKSCKGCQEKPADKADKK